MASGKASAPKSRPKTGEEMGFPPCEYYGEATVVFYKGFAYESHPVDPELDKLIDKMMDDELVHYLTHEELEVLESVRLPAEDDVEVTGGRQGPLQ